MGNIKGHIEKQNVHTLEVLVLAEGGQRHFKMCLPSQVPLKYFKIKKIQKFIKSKHDKDLHINTLS